MSDSYEEFPLLETEPSHLRGSEKSHIVSPSDHRDLSQAVRLVVGSDSDRTDNPAILSDELSYPPELEHEDLELWEPSVLFPARNSRPSLRIELREGRGKSRVVSSAYLTSQNDSLIVYAEETLRKKKGGTCKE